MFINVTAVGPPSGLSSHLRVHLEHTHHQTPLALCQTCKPAKTWSSSPKSATTLRSLGPNILVVCVSSTIMCTLPAGKTPFLCRVSRREAMSYTLSTVVDTLLLPSLRAALLRCSVSSAARSARGSKCEPQRGSDTRGTLRRDPNRGVYRRIVRYSSHVKKVT